VLKLALSSALRLIPDCARIQRLTSGKLLHHIEWIEIMTADGKAGKKFLKAGDKPESDFYTRMNVLGARAYCNVHGLWEMKTPAG